MLLPPNFPFPRTLQGCFHVLTSQNTAYLLALDKRHYVFEISFWQFCSHPIICNGLPVPVGCLLTPRSVWPAVDHVLWLFNEGFDEFLDTFAVSWWRVATMSVLLLHLNMHIFDLSLSFTSHPEKRSKGLFHHITKTHGTVICVSTGVVLLLLILSILVQLKQPRKKVSSTD